MGTHWVSQKTETNKKWWRFVMPDDGAGRGGEGRGRRDYPNKGPHTRT